MLTAPSRPADSLTGYAFMKMLLGALGYDSRHRGLHRRQLVHQRCQAGALNIGLDDGLNGEFNGCQGCHP